MYISFSQILIIVLVLFFFFGDVDKVSLIVFKSIKNLKKFLNSYLSQKN